MITAGFDPGASGAMAIFDENHPLYVFDMPVVEGHIDPQALVLTLRNHNPQFAIVEQVHAMPKQGVSSTFKFGRAYGTLIGVLGAEGIETHFVSPQRWKKEMGLSGKDKDAARQLAIERYPELTDRLHRKKDHGRADALLIGEYGYRNIYGK